jgi:hypothetical protein
MQLVLAGAGLQFRKRIVAMKLTQNRSDCNRMCAVPFTVWEENIERNLFSVQFLIRPLLETYM